MNKILKKALRVLYYLLIKKVPIFRPILETRQTASPITIKTWFMQKVLGFNRAAYWPTHFTSLISGVENIKIGIGTAPGLSPGCYISASSKIEIGDYTIIAPNVGILTANHSLHDYREYIQGDIQIGKYCWIAMNCVILPGVSLGDHTIVAAGSVVNKSFEEGYCVIAGSPAKVVKKIDPSKVTEHKNQYEYYGYIKKDDFGNFRKRHLTV